MKIQCPHCQVMHQAAKSLAGKQIKCDQCGGAFVIAFPTEPEPAETPVPARPVKAPQAKTPPPIPAHSAPAGPSGAVAESSGSRVPLLVAVAALALLAGVVAGGAGYVWLGGKPVEQADEAPPTPPQPDDPKPEPPVDTPLPPPRNQLLGSHEIAAWSERVDKQLKILKVSQPGALRMLERDPRATHVVHIADDCTADKFGSDQAQLLKDWVVGGGIVWARNDVFSLFNVASEWHYEIPWRPECTPGVNSDLCPILTGTQRVVVHTSRVNWNLTGERVVPLLSVEREGKCAWSLVPYGKGWVSDVKEIDQTKYDGARFWLHFRMFCLGRDIPGAPMTNRDFRKRWDDQGGGPGGVADPEQTKPPKDLLTDTAEAIAGGATGGNKTPTEPPEDDPDPEPPKGKLSNNEAVDPAKAVPEEVPPPHVPDRPLTRPEIVTWGELVDRELKILELSQPGAVRLLTRRPESVHVVHVADECTMDQFSSDEVQLLKNWVAQGGIVWAANDVPSLFKIGSKHLFDNTRCECTPAVTPALCPILAGCSRVVVQTSYGQSWDLTHENVIPLLSSPETVGGLGGPVKCAWSLVPYGEGWVSDVKKADETKYDGARFWLHFRMFCLGWNIPGAVTPTQEVRRDNVTVVAIGRPAGTRTIGGDPPDPPQPSAPPGEEPTVVTTGDEFANALTTPDEQRVMWVQLEKESVEDAAVQELTTWVENGGVLWLDTDLAKEFGFPLWQPSADQVPAEARISKVQHAVREGLERGEKVPFTLAANGFVVSGTLDALSRGMTPLLGWPVSKSRAFAVCVVRPLGKGMLVFRPRKIDTSSAAGRTLEENLRKFSFDVARPAAR